MSRTSLIHPSTLGYVVKQDMPQHLSILFRARPPLEYVEPMEKKRARSLSPLIDKHRDFLSVFEDGEPPKPTPIEKPQEKKERVKREKLASHIAQQMEESKEWQPHIDPHIKGDPYKTAIVSRLSYKTDEKKLKKEFEIFGPIKRIRVVEDKKTGKPRGYAFIEFEKERDFEIALQRGEGRRIDGRRVTVDYERGRTRTDWLPRRLGGGKGDTRRDREQEKMIRDLKKNHPLIKDRSRSRAKDVKNGKHEEVKVQAQEESHHRLSERDKKEKSRSRDRSREKHRKRDEGSLSKKEDRKDRERERSGRDKDRKKKDRKDREDKDRKNDGTERRSHKRYSEEKVLKSDIIAPKGNGAPIDEAEPGEIQD